MSRKERQHINSIVCFPRLLSSQRKFFSPQTMHQKVWPLPYFFSFSAYALSPINCPREKYEKAAMSPFCEKKLLQPRFNSHTKTAKKINLAIITRRLLEGLGERRVIEVGKKRGARPKDEDGEGEDCFSCFKNSPEALVMRQENRQSLLSLSFSSFFI